MTKLIPASMLGMMLLSACTQQAAYGPHVTAADRTLAAWEGSGPAAVQGTAYITRPDGQAVTCANSEVYLMPENNETDALLTQAPAALLAMPDADTRHYLRRTLCDGQGRFAFNGVPALNWIVATSVKWGVPVKYGTAWHGGPLAQRVTLKPGGNTIVLASKNFS